MRFSESGQIMGGSLLLIGSLVYWRKPRTKFLLACMVCLDGTSSLEGVLIIP